MSNRLENRTALVTGGSRGLGKAIALALAREGAQIIVCARNTEALNKVKSEIKNLGQEAYHATLDATDAGEVAKFFQEVVEKIGRLDILVNNVGGVEKYGSFLDLEDRDWQRSWNLNFMTMVHFTRQAIPWLKKSPAPRIINLCTVPAREPGSYNPHYSAAKAAMLNLNKHLANLLAPNQILVNAICPASIRSEAWEKKVEERAKSLNISHEEARKLQEEEDQKKVPLGRIGRPEDVARVVCFLASDQAGFLTGSCINVDGGVVKSIF